MTRRPSAVCLLLAVLAIVAFPSTARAGVTLAPFGVINLEVQPGEVIEYPLSMSVTADSSLMDMEVSVLGLTNSPDGRFIPVFEPGSALSACRWIGVDSPSFHLEPGRDQEITVTITVPEDATGGGSYAMISVHQVQPDTGGPLASLSAFNIPVLLTVRGPESICGCAIADISIVPVGDALNVITSLQNTGNHHLRVQVLSEMSDLDGRVVAYVKTPLSTSFIVPSAIVEFGAMLESQTTLAPGTYVVKSEVILEDGTALAQKSVEYQLTAAVAPPASLSQAPASTLADTTSSLGVPGWVFVPASVLGMTVVAGLMYLLGVRRGKRGI